MLIRILLSVSDWSNTCDAILRRETAGGRLDHVCAALDRVDGMRCVLGLFEGVVTGAADGYGRMMDKPAATLLHTGPGMANGLANLHNAKKAKTPIVNIVGDHARDHLRFESPLKSDAEGIARTVSAWVRAPAAVKN